MKIRVGHNIYGGNWAEIEVSEGIITEISVFRRIGEGIVSEYLTKPIYEVSHELPSKLELFKGKQFKI